MREDFDELKQTELEQDLELLKEDVERLRDDVSRLMWKSTLGKMEKKIKKKPLPSVLWAFGAGFAFYGLCRLLRSK